MIGLAATLVAIGFASEPPASSPPDRKPLVIEEIEETTVGDLDGHRVPMGNVTHGTYTLPDGTERTGNICSLVLPGQSSGVFVGAGSVVTIGAAQWTVLRVDNPTTDNGTVTLQKKP